MNGIYLLAQKIFIQYPVGSQLCEKTKQIRNRVFSITRFQGMFNRWKKLKINGQSGEISGATVDSLKERLLELL